MKRSSYFADIHTYIYTVRLMDKINMFENSFPINTLVNTCDLIWLELLSIRENAIRFVLFIRNLEVIMPHFRTT